VLGPTSISTSGGIFQNKSRSSSRIIPAGIYLRNCRQVAIVIFVPGAIPEVARPLAPPEALQTLTLTFDRTQSALGSR
jgi:hypothetical protein